MWTTHNRKRYDRSRLRYPSDLTDDEWALVAPLIPPAKRGGAKRTIDVREVMNGIMYILSTGCQWRALPKDLPPRSTVHGAKTRHTTEEFGRDHARDSCRGRRCASAPEPRRPSSERLHSRGSCSRATMDGGNAASG